MPIKAGDYIEYTDRVMRDYTLGDPALARYGVAVEDEKNNAVRVLGVDGKVIRLPMNRIQAYAFIPAYDMPEILEAKRNELKGYDNDWADGDY
jgi:hypothetical protein